MIEFKGNPREKLYRHTLAPARALRHRREVERVHCLNILHIIATF